MGQSRLPAAAARFSAQLAFTSRDAAVSAVLVRRSIARLRGLQRGALPVERRHAAVRESAGLPVGGRLSDLRVRQRRCGLHGPRLGLPRKSLRTDKSIVRTLQPFGPAHTAGPAAAAAISAVASSSADHRTNRVPERVTKRLAERVAERLADTLRPDR